MKEAASFGDGDVSASVYRYYRYLLGHQLTGGGKEAASFGDGDVSDEKRLE